MVPRSPLVIYYHSVAPAPFPDWHLRFLTMELERFEAQMHHVAERGWRSVFLDEWWALRNGEGSTVDDTICITFDDGLLDNWVYAFPVIRRLGLKMTLFVCPELIEPDDTVRPTLEDVWAGRCTEKELTGLGHLSWGELKRMQDSGHVDVQSHTMSHAKYPVSDRLRGFHYGGFKGFHALLNTCTPEEKPRYTSEKDLDRRIPRGSPLFEEASSVIARRLTPDPRYMREATELAGTYDLSDVRQRRPYEKEALRLWQQHHAKGSLIAAVESEEETQQRLIYEVRTSREVLETRLGKPVRFLCWPHGDNSHAAHALARQCGYLATTAGRMTEEGNKPDRIPRVGTDWDLHPWLVKRKFDYKFYSNQGRQPYRTLWLANAYKNRLLGRS